MSRPVQLRGVGSSGRRVAYAALRGAIVRLELRPGSRVREGVLAERLAFDRAGIRAAMRRLCDDGLMQVVPDGGMIVSPIRLGDVAEAQFDRETLECAAVRVALRRTSGHELGRLARIVDLQEASSASGDIQRYYALDDAFHMAICELSGHPVWCTTQEFGPDLNRVRRLSLSLPGCLRAYTAAHRSVVAALVRRDASEAEATLRQHLKAVVATTGAVRRIYPEYFADLGTLRPDQGYERLRPRTHGPGSGSSARGGRRG